MWITGTRSRNESSNELCWGARNDQVSILDVVEIVQIPVGPDAQKTLTPAAVTAPKPSLFENPDREGGDREDKRKRRSGRGSKASDHEDPGYHEAPKRGTRIDIRA